MSFLSRYLEIIVPIDLMIFLFLWSLIAAWMRLFQVYRLSSLITPVILGSVCWSLSLYVRYGLVPKFRPQDAHLFVVTTVVCFIASIQVIRAAVAPFEKREGGGKGKNRVVVREILPTAPGEWLLFGAIFAGWVAFSRYLSIVWKFPLGVFVVLFISRTIWRSMSDSDNGQ